MVTFWRNQLRMGGMINNQLGDAATAVANGRNVSLETGPAFMGRLTAMGSDMRTAFTSVGNNCPTFNASTGTFTDGSCFTGATVAASTTTTVMGNNVAEGQQAGILTNPGFMAQYYSNFGFRRQRVIQEIFACARFPAEIAATPQIINSALYSAPWPLKTITSNAAVPSYTGTRRVQAPGAAITSQEYVDFNLETGCYNCHTTMNHRAPLFSAFDAVGFFDATGRSMVHSTVTGSPFALKQDYIPLTENTAWRYQVPANTIQEFGRAMAADPQIAKCMMIRLWNDAYSRDDVVNDLALVPDSVIAPMTQYFIDNNYNMKMAIKKLYTDANFIRF